MRLSPAAVVAGVTLPATALAFVPNSPSFHRPSITQRSVASSSWSLQEDLTFTPPDTLNDADISEIACAEAASLMKRVKVPVPEYINNDKSVGISYIHWPADARAKRENKNALPLLLVHGLDSSCLEYRRLGPKLAALGIDTYAVDLLGWGYTQLDDVNTFSAQAKVDALAAFWEVVGQNQPVCIAGASLGGAASIEYASSSLVEGDGIVQGAIFIDAQGFIDGIGPMASLPPFLAKAGIQVLKSEPLRESANQMSYYDKEAYATEDALKVGRYHCLRDGWDDAFLSFMQSGGFSPSSKVDKIDVPSLILWGRQDGILDGKEFTKKFVEALPDTELRWIEECGHVPHLEQPDITAETIASFLRSDKFENMEEVSTTASSSPFNIVSLGAAGAAAVAAGTAAVTLIGSN
uniref:AB hydrolase-1 domain-containing protein n=1 Tax=Helicotheca tamesis TaxID=374047 RepID=A0A6U0GZQ1_9STRA|mmetsp:Transcript_362/g.429  ORF Transcript_362/g.429 Transcript_362/m.429 type:complete len:408 (+) Transcript_362:81-1304(+)|eukprot:CAMPEP_0185727466 /NCGR_PEP_ID=MMETSP1171-20130828/3150_1 /TAXON_ID=374046 /ORGANISM="Helicotheca tamensis, Strain CCMP826" /LENGTH=407 /DNA_ID=CAMNT_0028396043 /DNA_START=65 /DNA_END=1288 /DNA_ORIENTATION=-